MLEFVVVDILGMSPVCRICRLGTSTLENWLAIRKPSQMDAIHYSSLSPANCSVPLIICYVCITFVITSSLMLQLDCPSARHWDYVTTFAVGVLFQIQDHFWILHQKLHGACYLDFLNLKTCLFD